MRLLDLLSRIKINKLTNGIDCSKNVKPQYCLSNVTDGLYFLYINERGERSIPIDQLPCDAILITDVCDVRKNNTIYVDNARLAMSISFVLEYSLDFNKLKVIGITGTNGKTTTTTILYDALRRLGKKIGLIGTGRILIDGERVTDDFYSMTTPPPSLLFESLKKMQDIGCEYCVMEVSSHSLDQDRVSGIEFYIAAFLNLSSEHLDYHGTIESYFMSKQRLFSQSEYSIFNNDNEYSQRASKEYDGKGATIGIKEDSDIRLSNVKSKGLYGSSFYYTGKKGSYRISTPLPALHNIYNVAFAVAILEQLNIPKADIIRTIKEVEKIDGRLQIVHKRPTVIIDYAHTSDAVENALKYLYSVLSKRQRLIVVYGCGGDRDVGKRTVIGKCVCMNSSFSIITEDNSRTESTTEIIRNITSDLEGYSNYTVIPDRKEAIETALKMARSNDIVAILGKGHERYIIRGKEKVPFNEETIVKDFFKG